MLYINASINKVPIQAFVDSGAQSTVMSAACAERCGVMRLVDNRFAGMAVGVGTSRIIGRVHAAEIMIEGKFITCSLTVIESGGVDFLLGLDMLKRFNVIDVSNPVYSRSQEERAHLPGWNDRHALPKLRRNQENEKARAEDANIRLSQNKRPGKYGLWQTGNT